MIDFGKSKRCGVKRVDGLLRSLRKECPNTLLVHSVVPDFKGLLINGESVIWFSYFSFVLVVMEFGGFDSP